MSTQNERDMFIKLFPLAIDMATGNMKVAYMVAFDAFKAARAPLLSRIEWLEAEKHSWQTYAKGLNSRIDALSKDAERLDYLDTINKRFSMGWKVVKAPAGNVSINSIICLGGRPITIREAIDAAISAREGSDG